MANRGTLRTRTPIRVRAREDVIAVGLLLLVLVIASLPPLLNAAGTHSDAAIVGLQAMHLLRGETSFFLWGSGYQTSADSWVAAAFFRMFGPTALSLMLSTFVGYVLLMLFAYATIRRRFRPGSAALLVSPLAVMTGPAHVYAFYPPRQAALTVLFAAIWVLDGAPTARKPVVRLTLGAFMGGLATLADPYCLLFMPAILLFILLTARELDANAFSARPMFFALGSFAAGLVPLWLVSHGHGAARGVYGLTTRVFVHNLKLLSKDCLPFLLSVKVRYFSQSRGLAWWEPPGWFHLIQLLGAASIISGIVLGGVSLFSRKLPFDLRRLGGLGAPMLPITLAAFLLSVMAIDHWSARYLVSIVLFAPFALSPLVRLVGPSRFACMLAPYLLSTAVGAWLDNGSNVDGWRIRRENGTARDEGALAAFFRARGLHHGIADYWVAYRLTFLFHEDPTIVPWHPELDRYAPYRRAVEAEPVIAYLYDPSWSTEDLAYRTHEFRAGNTAFESDFEEVRVGRYSVLILHRRRHGGAVVAGAYAPAHDGAPPHPSWPARTAGGG